MRLLFDEQLSEDLVGLLHDPFPNSIHVRQQGLGGASDRQVWNLARDNECILVTKDEDFHRLSVVLGAPPKVVWIRIGNSTTEEVAELLRKRVDDIRRFVDHAEVTLLEL